MLLIDTFERRKRGPFSLVSCESMGHKGERTRLIERCRARKTTTHICASCCGREQSIKNHQNGIFKDCHPMLGKHHSNETKEKMRLAKLGMYDGDKHYNWNPNLTDEDRTKRNHHKRNTPKDFEWIRSVLKRDNYRCQICGTTSNKLCAHHLNGYADFPDQRYDVENGATLCKKHHKKFHSSYRLSEITKENFLDFVSHQGSRP